MSSTPPGSTPAGWYPDTNQPGTLRYWDGNAWTEHTHAGQAPGSQALGGQAQGGQANTGYQTYAPGMVGPAGVQVYQPGMSLAPGIGQDSYGRPTFMGRPICGPWERFAAYLLDGLLMLVTLGIGWIVWACFTAQHGQTPARKMLGQRVLRFSEGSVATFGWMLGMRGFVAGLVVGLAWQCILPGLVLAFMPFWDDKNQTLTDKISSCVVISES